MTLPRFTHIMPSSLNEALDLLHEKGETGRIKAGGSDFVVAMKHKTALPEFVLNMAGLKELDFIRPEPGGGLVIGVLTTLSAIVGSEQVRKQYPILSQAAGKVATVQIRNVATIGGNVCLDTRCWYYNQSAQWRKAVALCYKLGGDRCHVIKNSDKCNAVFLADTVPALMALDAQLKVVRKGAEKIISMEKFYNESGHPPNLLRPDELVSEIHIPRGPEKAFTFFYKDAPRDVIDFALVNLAMRIDFQNHDGVCKSARIAVGGVTSFPVFSEKGVQVLKGEKITGALIDKATELVLKEIAPISPIWVSPGQRRQTVGVFVKRGLTAALAQNLNK
ncbi:MAG: FAD binding domain-containing protein [Desulfobacterales bacterium]|nr:FAD binding domain-containing protein [Desulfobacterales bacterium]